MPVRVNNIEQDTLAIPRMQVIVSNLPFIRAGFKAVKHSHKARVSQFSISGNADISVYIQVYLAKLLAEDAQIGVIGPYSWLCAGYAMQLQLFLVENYTIHSVKTSWVEKWFGAEVDVRAVILIFENTKRPSVVSSPCQFVTLLKPLLNFKKQGTEQCNDNRINNYERLVPQKELRCTTRVARAPGIWNRYLRAPEVYFEILHSCGNRLTELQKIARIKPGVKSGINAFFYVRIVRDNQGARRKRKVLIETQCKNRFYIEEEFLKPLVRSPRDLSTVAAPDAHALEYRAFVCQEDRSTLRKRKCFGALKFIKWGESKINKIGTPWPFVPSVQARRNWWCLTETDCGDVLLPMSTSNRFAVFESPKGAFVDHNLFTCTFDSPAIARAALAYMNSSVFALFREVHARVGLGGGAAKLELSDWSHVPVPRELSTMPSVLPGWFARPVEPIVRELERPEWHELDALILHSMGLEPDVYLERIVDGIVQMVAERMNK